MRESRKGEEWGTNGKRTETECVLVEKVKGRNRLENPDVRYDDKTIRKMDLTLRLLMSYIYIWSS